MAYQRNGLALPEENKNLLYAATREKFFFLITIGIASSLEAFMVVKWK